MSFLSTSWKFQAYRDQAKVAKISQNQEVFLEVTPKELWTVIMMGIISSNNNNCLKNEKIMCHTLLSMELYHYHKAGVIVFTITGDW